MKLFFVLVALMFAFSLASAEILSAKITESGDAGKDFSKNLSTYLCADGSAQAVYTCNGNVVKIVHKNQSKGSTFYKPDGTVLLCPSVSAAQMGAACVQMLLPNVCLKESVCGTSPVLPFPGQQNVSATSSQAPVTQPPVSNATQPVTQPAQNKTTVQPQVQPLPVPVQQPAPASDNETQPAGQAKPKSDNNLALVVLATGIILVAAINFFYFRSRRQASE